MNENKIPRVLHVIDSPFIIGGVEAMLMNWYRHIDRTKIQFDFLTLHNYDHKIISPYQAEIEQLGGRYLKVYAERIRHHFRLCKKIKEVFTSEPYIAVHMHRSPRRSLFFNMVSYYAWRYQVPKRIIHSHGTKNTLEKSSYSLFDLYTILCSILYPQKHNVQLACSGLAGETMFENANFQIVKNAINTNLFKFDPEQRKILRESLGISENIKTVGHIGRFDNNKNQSFLIDIFSELKKINPNVFLIMVGDGESKATIEKKVDELELQNDVLFTGNKANTENYYSAFDCFVLPSLLEGLGIVNIEAQASGLPCLISDSVPQDTQIFKTAEFFPLSATPHAWAKKIIKILQQPIDRTAAAIEVKDAGWDIISATQKLQNFYLNETLQ